MTHTIHCIVGMGPRGTSTLERLLASIPELLPHDAQLTIHVVDPSPPGPGRVWRVNQSPDLLMNTASCQVTLFTDDTVECSGPIHPGLNLHEWAVQSNINLDPNEYPTRALYGRYLEWVFGKILRKAPANVKVEVHASRAISLDEEPSGFQTLTLSNGRILSGISTVILAQGHVPSLPSAQQHQSTTYANQHGLHYFPPSNPADLDLSPISPNEPVLLRGLGLCFFDYMALLTIGRGGKFVKTDTGLRYSPSGLEPRMYATSRRGIPFHARGDNQKGAFGRRFPVHLTDESIIHFRERVETGNALNFKSDIWPLIAKDVELVYYECLMGKENVEFHGRFLDAQRGNGPTETQVLDEFKIPHNKRWSWERIQRPQGERTFATPNDFKTWLLEYLYSDVEEAALGNVEGPLKAALDMLRDLRNELRQVVDHNGLSGISHAADLDGWYSSLNAFLSIGPPRERIEQMIALMEAGILDILGPEPEVWQEDGAWLARSRKVSESTVRVTTLIEARLPEPKLKDAADELLSYLLRTGQCRPHIIEGYETGGLDVTPSPYNPIDSQGRVHERRFVLGVPTEGVHWVTTVGARPGVDSVLLRDTDAVAQAALRRGRRDIEN
ncbi:FAD-NAD(P)-binding-domain-containing protein [Annulohypoxylon bovei var. microspora]|nr:FAD-NAD(P)-binding-domain-containing protein [Annulohypoxylon bovei var. microspora]